MYRVIVKRWDAVNRRVSARCYRVYSDCLQVTEYHSPLGLYSPKDARRKMTRVRPVNLQYVADWFGFGFIEELTKVRANSKRWRNKVLWSIPLPETRVLAKSTRWYEGATGEQYVTNLELLTQEEEAGCRIR